MPMRGEKRKKKAPEPPPIPDTQIRNEAELREVLKSFDPALDSHARKTLLEGFEKIRQRMEANKKLESVSEGDFGGFKPAPLVINQDFYSLDNFIRKRMGGERDGLLIKWQFQGKVWTYHPWTGSLTSDDIDGNN